MGIWSIPSILLRKSLSGWRQAGRYLFDGAAIAGVARSSPDTILLVYLGGIGDFIVWLSAARALREHYRDRRIVLAANRIFAELAECVGCFDEVIEVDVKAFDADLRYRFETLRRIRRIGAGIAIQPTYSRVFWGGDAIMRAARAPETVGFAGDLNNSRPWQRRMADRWYTRLVPAQPGRLNEFERNAEFLRALSGQELAPTIARIAPVAELPDRLRIADDYFIVFPGAGAPRRMWPAGSFGVAAQAIGREQGWRLVVCGGAEEAELAASVIAAAGLPDALQMAGRTSLTEFVELVRGARLVVANETSAVHIAAAVGTPSVCVLGGGHFGRFVPYPEGAGGCRPVAVFKHMDCFNCDWDCTLTHRRDKAAPCVEAIPVQDVVDAARVCGSAG